MAIHAESLSRHFVVREAHPGLFGFVRGLVGVRKKRVIHAVDEVSFRIGPGEVVGLIGPNGAGKSTIVKMVTGIIPCTSGTVRTLGLDPFRNRIETARRYGVVFGQRSQLWWHLSPRETFKALTLIYELEPGKAARQIDYLVQLLELAEFLSTPVRQLSLGQKVRCDIAAALLHQPELLILDEPTIGLDVVVKCRIRDYILRLNQEMSLTVLLTSHDMVDVERLCGRVLVIDKGRLVYDGPLAPLREQFGPERHIIIDFAREPEQFEITRAELVQKENRRIVLRFDGRQHSAMEVLAEVMGSQEVMDFSVQELPIDEVISRIYQRKKGGPVGGGGAVARPGGGTATRPGGRAVARPGGKT